MTQRAEIERLEPCPFCNALTAMLEDVPDDHETTLYRVRCQECSLQTRQSCDPETVVSLWNTRAQSDALSGKREEELREALATARVAICQALVDVQGGRRLDAQQLLDTRATIDAALNPKTEGE